MAFSGVTCRRPDAMQRRSICYFLNLGMHSLAYGRLRMANNAVERKLRGSCGAMFAGSDEGAGGQQHTPSDRQAPRYAHRRSEIPTMTPEAFHDRIADLFASAELCAHQRRGRLPKRRASR